MLYLHLSSIDISHDIICHCLLMICADKAHNAGWVYITYYLVWPRQRDLGCALMGQLALKGTLVVGAHHFSANFCMVISNCVMVPNEITRRAAWEHRIHAGIGVLWRYFQRQWRYLREKELTEHQRYAWVPTRFTSDIREICTFLEPTSAH